MPKPITQEQRIALLNKDIAEREKALRKAKGNFYFNQLSDLSFIKKYRGGVRSGKL